MTIPNSGASFSNRSPNGVVIPIVGRDLLRIEIDRRQQLLYEYLAAKLAAEFEVECEPLASIESRGYFDGGELVRELRKSGRSPSRSA
jgi:hypothetical protein